MDLNTSVDKVSRAYKMYAKRLEKLGIFKLEDFLFHVPFRYDDFSLVSTIDKIQAGETVTIKGILENIENQYTRRFKTLQKATIKDETGSIDAIWFNQPFLTRALKKGDNVSLSGKISLSKNKLGLISPDYEVIFENQTIHTGRLVPVYPETKGISSKWLRRQVYKLLEQKNEINEYLPESVTSNNHLMDLGDALEKIHFPNTLEEAQKARDRLSFDELFELQLSSLVRKKEWEKETIKKPFELKKFQINIDKFIKSLPFELTNAQKREAEVILNDISSNTPMNRLLEGDVGSGKTVVAAIAMYLAYLNKNKSLLMAPTEILANQHYKTIVSLLSPFGITVGLITGSSKKDKDKNFDIFIGTHALIYQDIKNVRFVIIDEQQRFGVEQRGILREKGKNIHVLTMTATPIPRTVALTIYGDLDLSVLNEMPKGRIDIKTWLVPPQKRDGAYNWIGKQITENKDQVFIVCPFIEESESMITVKAATKEFERLKKEVFPKLRLGLLHGKIKAKEKEEILQSFRNGDIDILVSTPVVEVGIDIPNATIMMIEEAERFGLAQLHQLRGRVGRGEKQSYCLLFTQSKNSQTLDRLKALETMHSGAELAELDLKLRGPGQIYGVMQHGVANLRVANFSDFELIEKTKKEAQMIFANIDDYPELNKKINRINSQQISPD